MFRARGERKRGGGGRRGKGRNIFDMIREGRSGGVKVKRSPAGTTVGVRYTWCLHGDKMTHVGGTAWCCKIGGLRMSACLL